MRPNSKLAAVLAGGSPEFTPHPQAFYDTLADAIELMVGMVRTTSPTSNSSGAGTRVFSLADSAGWSAGTPLYITADAAPADAYMVGYVASSMALGDTTVTVTVEEVGTDLGTYSAWTLRVADSARTLTTPPLSIANGGTSASTEAGARDALQVGRHITVRAVRDTVPPSGLSSGEFFLVGGSPAGAIFGHEDEVAISDGAGGVSGFIIPTNGMEAYHLSGPDSDGSVVAQGGSLYVYTAGGDPAGLWEGSGWNVVAVKRNRSTLQKLTVTTTTTLTISQLVGSVISLEQNTAGSYTLTLPLPGPDPDNPFYEFYVLHRPGASTWTINISGGKLFKDGTAGTKSSLTVANGEIIGLMCFRDSANLVEYAVISRR